MMLQMDNKEEKYFLEVPALKVTQPLGDFYVITISAEKLLAITFSEPLGYIDNTGNVKGSQRPKDIRRLKEIGTYIDSVEMAFPNTIILAANYTSKGNISKDETERWKLEEKENGICTIKIPKEIKLAAIIDGQHRLNAFEFVKNPERFTNLQLVCSVYFDLPNSYQAFLFATINSNQKKVDRSLALEQFGYNVNDEPEKAWTPEKFAVFLSRKLNIDKVNSPLYQHIKVAPLSADILFSEGLMETWVVSTATIVDGICRLITSNPKRDRVRMQQATIFHGRNREMLREMNDSSPLRMFFIDGKDKTILDTIVNYFNAFNKLFWSTAGNKSYIIKTVGVQASFDILRYILLSESSLTPENINFENYLSKVKGIDFADKFFQASGIGRSRIKNIIGIAIGLINKDKIKKNDLPFFEDLLSGKNTKTPVDKLMWEEDAENAVINALGKAEWDYNGYSVSLFLDGDYEHPVIFTAYDKFFLKLVELAELAFTTSLPGEGDYSEEQKEKFNAEDLVQSNLSDYEENLKRLKWIE